MASTSEANNDLSLSSLSSDENDVSNEIISNTFDANDQNENQIPVRSDVVSAEQGNKVIESNENDSIRDSESNEDQQVVTEIPELTTAQKETVAITEPSTEINVVTSINTEPPHVDVLKTEKNDTESVENTTEDKFVFLSSSNVAETSPNKSPSVIDLVSQTINAISEVISDSVNQTQTDSIADIKTSTSANEIIEENEATEEIVDHKEIPTTMHSILQMFDLDIGKTTVKPTVEPSADAIAALVHEIVENAATNISYQNTVATTEPPRNIDDKSAETESAIVEQTERDIESSTTFSSIEMNISNEAEENSTGNDESTNLSLDTTTDESDDGNDSVVLYASDATTSIDDSTELNTDEVESTTLNGEIHVSNHQESTTVSDESIETTQILEKSEAVTTETATTEEASFETETTEATKIVTSPPDVYDPVSEDATEIAQELTTQFIENQEITTEQVRTTVVEDIPQTTQSILDDETTISKEVSNNNNQYMDITTIKYVYETENHNVKENSEEFSLTDKPIIQILKAPTQETRPVPIAMALTHQIHLNLINTLNQTLKKTQGDFVIHYICFETN